MKIICLLLLLAVPCHAATKNARNLRTGIDEKVWKQLEGTWIRKDFIHELYDRHSLYNVLRSSGITSDSYLRKFLICDFWNNENATGYSFGVRDKLCPVTSLSPRGDSISIGLDRTEPYCREFPRSVRLTEKKGRYAEIEILKTAYVRLKDYPVARTLLAGSYHDEKKRVYQFRADGMAVWPDRKFLYLVEPRDYVLDNFAGIRSDLLIAARVDGAGKDEHYCFSWEKGDLLLRSVVNSGGKPVGCEPAIAYRLTPFYFETLK